MTNNIFAKIDELTRNEKYNEVVDLIMSEIKNPLYTLNEQELLNNALSIAVKNKNDKKLTVSKKDLMNEYLSNHYNRYTFETLIAEFAQELTEREWQIIGQIFLDNEIDNQTKLSYFDTIISACANPNMEFNFYNNFTQNMFKINTKSTYSISSFAHFSEALNKLSNYYFKDVSKFKMGQKVVNDLFFAYFFDCKFKYYNSGLGANIIEFIKFCFQENNNVDKDFIEFIAAITGSDFS